MMKLIQKNILPESFNSWLDFYSNVNTIDDNYIFDYKDETFIIDEQYLLAECFKELTKTLLNVELFDKKFINEKLLMLLYNDSTTFKTNLNEKKIKKFIEILNIMCNIVK